MAKPRDGRRGSGQSQYSPDDILRMIRSRDETALEQLMRLPPERLLQIPKETLLAHGSVQLLCRVGLAGNQDLMQLLAT